jgi:hypothetical protein
MLYWSPVDVRAFLRRWTVLKALIMSLMLIAPKLPAVAAFTEELGVFRGTIMLFWYVLAGVVWIWGCADYARSKGYSGWWGLMCAPLPLGPFGLLVLFLFPDRWDPKHRDWKFEADPLLIDGRRMVSAREARAMLRESALAKLGSAGAMWIIVLVIAAAARNWFSAESRPTLEVIAYGVAFTASFIGLWGAAHLARYKGYSPLWAITGFALIPVAIAMAWATSADFITGALLLLSMLLGPITLLFMPEQWSDVGISPMKFNPNEMGDLNPEPVFVDHHGVRIVNPY